MSPPKMIWMTVEVLLSNLRREQYIVLPVEIDSPFLSFSFLRGGLGYLLGFWRKPGGSKILAIMVAIILLFKSQAYIARCTCLDFYILMVEENRELA